MSDWSLRDVSRTYLLDSVKVPALCACNVTFSPGEAVALVGPSGSGKSTLLHVASLLDVPSAGGVWYGDREVSALDDNARSDLRLNHLGFVHQTYPMVSALSPLENVALPARYAGRADAAERARRLLEQVGLAKHAHRDVRTLSGGERQRVAIARALVNTPVVVFADEPTAALDAENGERVLDLLFGLVRQTGTRLVLATHDPGVAVRANRIVRLRGGMIQ